MSTAVKERPIFFNAEMVRAILAGRKTQTRRAFALRGFLNGVSNFGPSDTPGYDWSFRDSRQRWNDLRGEELIARCPYGVPGDRLWVRETWARIPVSRPSGYFSNPKLTNKNYWYKATDCQPTWGGGKWRPAIRMPKDASRITLEVTGVRVERLNDISDQDAIAEGVRVQNFTGWGDEPGIPSFPEPDVYLDYQSKHCDWLESSTQSFQSLWESINGEGSWSANPFVWVIEFKRIIK